MLNEALKTRTFATDEFIRIDALKKEVECARSVGDEQLEKDRFKANQVVRFEEHLRAILHAEGRKEALFTQARVQNQQISSDALKTR